MESKLPVPLTKQMGTAFDSLDPPDANLYLDCVHCGLCLPSCPTYVVLGNEMDSPRGRIYLIRAASEGRIDLSSSFVKHMDLCLLCRNCETACPSGVQFGFVMEAARGQIERQYDYPAKEKRFRRFILHTFTDLRRLTVLCGLLRFYQRSGLQKLARSLGVLKLFGRLGKMESLLPSIPDQRIRKEFSQVFPAVGEKRARVGLLLGCVQRFFFPEVNLATAYVLSQNGYEVVAVNEQECCGSLLIHEGERERGKGLAMRMINVFDQAGVDLVVVNAAGCGSVMKSYGELLRNDPEYAGRAEAFSRKVRDVSELLGQHLLKGRMKPLGLKATYHDACHLAHGQRVREEPRSVLRQIPGLDLVELRESDFCCGSAGIYNLLHPELAQDFLDRKVERIKDTGAQVVISGNPGCSLQIEKGLRERNIKIRVAHLVELLAWSYEGSVPRDV